MSMNLVLFLDGERVKLIQTRTDQTYYVLALPKEEQFEAYLGCLLSSYVDKHSRIPRPQVIDIMRHGIDLGIKIAQAKEWHFDMQ